MAVPVSSMPLNGWRPCVPISPTRGNRWFVIMGTLATFVGEMRQKENDDARGGIQVEAFVQILPRSALSQSRQTGPYIVASFTIPAGKNIPQPQDVDKPFPLIHNASFCILDPPKSEFLSLIPFGIIHVIRPGYSLWFFITHVLLPMPHTLPGTNVGEFYFKYTALCARFVACL